MLTRRSDYRDYGLVRLMPPPASYPRNLEFRIYARMWMGEHMWCVRVVRVSRSDFMGPPFTDLMTARQYKRWCEAREELRRATRRAMRAAKRVAKVTVAVTPPPATVSDRGNAERKLTHETA